jgi:ABC-type phosphate transport system substrate-binding protein
MSHPKILKASCLSLLLAATTMTASTPVHANQKARLAIVVAKGSPVSTLSSNELKRLFLGATVTGPGGSRLIGINQAQDAPERLDFAKVVLGMSPDELGRYWIDRRIRGQSGPPKSLSTAEQVRKAIAHNPNAIGYLRVTDLGPDIKVIPIDGIDPKAAGFGELDASIAGRFST